MTEVHYAKCPKLSQGIAWREKEKELRARGYKVITPRSNSNPAQCEALAMGHLGVPKAESLGACERALRVERKDMGTSGLVRDSRVYPPGV